MKVARTRQHENEVRSGLKRCARSRQFKCSFEHIVLHHQTVGSELSARSSTLPRILFGMFELRYDIDRA